jgi:hypothetical protein
VTSGWRRPGRFLFVGVTNFFFVLPFVDYFCCSIWHYEHWYLVFEARRFWTFLAAAAILGIILDVVHPKSARIVNIGLWSLFVLKITGMFLLLWGRFLEDSWMTFFIVPLCAAVIWADLALYRVESAATSGKYLGE